MISKFQYYKAKNYLKSLFFFNESNDRLTCIFLRKIKNFSQILIKLVFVAIFKIIVDKLIC